MFRKLAIGSAAGAGVVGAFYYSQQQTKSPPESLKRKTPKYELPSKVEYLLIGGGASTSGAYKAIRASIPKAQILIVGQEEYQPYMKAPLSKELWQGDAVNDKLIFKQWNGKYRSILFENPEFFANLDSFKQEAERRVAYVGGLRAVKVDPVNQKVFFDDGSSIAYERCLISSGSTLKPHPVLSKVRGAEKHLLTLSGVDDFKKIQKAALEDEAIAVFGGGTVASELTYNMFDFAKRANPKLKVFQFFPEVGNLSSILPEFLSKWVTKQMIAEGVEVISGADIASAEVLNNNKLRLHLTSGKSLTVDKVVLAENLEPDVELAEASGLEVDSKNGGIVVNSELAARSNLYVAGDASSFYDPRLGRRRFYGHEHAVSTGALAGRNMTGAQKPYSRQTLMWSDISTILNVEGVGVLDPSLKSYSVFFPESPEENTDFDGKITKGVVFYLNNKHVVVGILLCNIFGKMATARKIISQQKESLDLKEVAKVFYEKYLPEDEIDEASKEDSSV